ncbi:MAG: VCBS repeat-containing protein, partial [Bacteroidota bacterium]
KLEAKMMESSVFINNRNGTFTTKALPKEAQLSPVYGISVGDYDGDGKADIITGGNFYESKPEVGIYDGSYGLFLKGDGNGNFISIPAEKSGIVIRGAVRDIIQLHVKKRNFILIAKNNQQTELIQY